MDLVLDRSRENRSQFVFTRMRVSTRRGRLPAGEYGALADDVVAAVERKSLSDLAGRLLSGRLRYPLAKFAAPPRAAVVVEDRYASAFRLEHVRASALADAIAEAQVRWPNVPIFFAETRPLAEELTYCLLGAAVTDLQEESAAAGLEATLPPARPLPRRGATTAEVRAWALSVGYEVPNRGRLRPEVWTAYEASDRGGLTL